MIPRREELVEATPLSPRVSDVSDESAFMRGQDYLDSPATEASQWADGKERGAWSGKVRHAVGIALLIATVFLWTASNFLASVRCPRPRQVARLLATAMQANARADHICRQLVLQALLCHLRKHLVFHHTAVSHAPAPPVGRPPPARDRSPTPPATPRPTARPFATTSRKMVAVSPERVPLLLSIVA